jgi:hypothetical protein
LAPCGAGHAHTRNCAAARADTNSPILIQEYGHVEFLESVAIFSQRMLVQTGAKQKRNFTCVCKIRRRRRGKRSGEPRREYRVHEESLRSRRSEKITEEAMSIVSDPVASSMGARSAHGRLVPRAGRGGYFVSGLAERFRFFRPGA